MREAVEYHLELIREALKETKVFSTATPTLLDLMAMKGADGEPLRVIQRLLLVTTRCLECISYKTRMEQWLILSRRTISSEAL